MPKRNMKRQFKYFSVISSQQISFLAKTLGVNKICHEKVSQKKSLLFGVDE